ncbi:MAG: hypothetical protein R3E90_15825 [Marinicella sp.]|nr:hypothetical protein [Xanthomonadales bacterium]
MNLVKQLEQLAQKHSLKQFDSVESMLIAADLKQDVLLQSHRLSEELVCFVEPEDED